MVVAAGVIGSVAAPSVAEPIVGGERDAGADLAAATGAALAAAPLLRRTRPDIARALAVPST